MKTGQLTLVVGITLNLGACATTPKSCRALPASGPATLLLPNGRNVVVADRLDQASIAELQCGADQGLQAAQVALGRLYEAGDRVPRDVALAAALYERAATSIPPTTAIYSPPVTVGGRGQMLFLNNPNGGPGSAEAQYRLGRLMIEGRGIALDPKRGRALIERSAMQGYAPAIDELGRSPN
jgi:TPR repeat protein